MTGIARHESAVPTITGIIETGLYVDDMQRAVEFYHRLCGFPTLLASERITALRVRPGQVLLLFARGASAVSDDLPTGIPPHDGSGQQHIAFGIQPDELDAWRVTLAEQAIEIESTVTWPQGGESLYFRDPDGHSIELKTSDWDGELLSPPEH